MNPSTEPVIPKKSRTTRILPNRRKPKGKIAELPADLRQFINESLRNGLTLQKVCDALAERGHPGISRGSMYHWYSFGYQLWLAEQARLDDSRIRAEASCQLVRDLKADGHTDFADTNDLVLASQIHEALQEFNSRTITSIIAEKPETFFRLAAVITEQAAGQTRRQKSELELQKYRDHVEAQKAKITAATTRSKTVGGLTEEDLRAIEEAANIL